jgi:hypothetical protein
MWYDWIGQPPVKLGAFHVIVSEVLVAFIILAGASYDGNAQIIKKEGSDGSLFELKLNAISLKP